MAVPELSCSISYTNRRTQTPITPTICYNMLLSDCRPQEIGLKSLTQISRGAVRVEKNPLLCFVDTIDWSRIAINAESKENFFSQNKPKNECPICPSGKKVDNSGSESTKDLSEALECPIASSDPKQRLCWNRQNCQIGKCPSDTNSNRRFSK